MKETVKDVNELLANDTPENRQAFEEKYGSFFLNVMTSTLIDSFGLSRDFRGKPNDLIAIVSSYKDPSTIEPLKRAFKRDVKGFSKTAIMRAICQFEDPKATKFLISLIGSEKDDKQARTFLKQYPYHMKMLKTLKPELVEVVSTPAAEPVKKKLQCHKCGRTANQVKIMQCRMCGRPFCVDHNNYNGFCSITCAK